MIVQEARIKEIQDRVDKATPAPWMYLFGDEIIYEKLEDGCRGLPIARAALGNHYNNAQFIANAPDDIEFLLAALEEAQDRNKQQIEIKNNLATLYSQSQERERQLQAKNHDLELSVAAVRAANDAWKKLVHELQLEIIKPKNQEVLWTNKKLSDSPLKHARNTIKNNGGEI